MFKHILIATDGSELSGKAVKYGIELARTLNAKVTAITATVPWQALAAGEAAIVIDPEDYETRTGGAAEARLKPVSEAAKAAGVSCTTVHVRNTQPWQAIIDAARSHGCDLIVLASHGRRGVIGFLIGSETQKVLTHSSVPVLVYR